MKNAVEKLKNKKNKKKSVKKSLIKKMKIKKRESQSLKYLKMIRGIEIYKRADYSALNCLKRVTLKDQ